MAGTHIGGLKAAKRNKELKGENWYVEIGRAGGKAGKGYKGFATRDPEKIREAARKGGSASRRTKKIIQRELKEQ